MPRKQEQPLKPEEIRYLALEGGGGKGFAYLGAIQVLEELQVMSRVQGISGTSAGAITALMLSIGMTAQDVEKELVTNDFNTFYDPPLDRQGRRLVPRPFEYEQVPDNDCERTMLSGKADIGTMMQVVPCLRDNDSFLARIFWGLGWTYQAEGISGRIAREVLAGLVLSRMAPNLRPIITVLMRYLPQYLVYFDRDMGFFSGKAARDYFDRLIRRQAALKDANYADPKAPSMPFIVHKRVFGTDLLICGANLSTGKSVLFSHKHTPYFPVADAVRISMSLPAFKPYVIRQHVPGWPPCGTYVDGGVWNNLPFREIGTMAALPGGEGTQERKSSVSTLSDGRHTLGLRLEINEPKPVLRGGEIMSKFLELGLTAGESQVIADIEPFTITLDTRGLDTLIFKPPDAVQKDVTRRSRQDTYRYFGQAPPEEGPIDPQLLKERAERYQEERKRKERKLCQ